MKIFLLGVSLLTVLLLTVLPSYARINQSERTIGFLRQWSQAVAVHRDNQTPIPCLHTMDVAQEHAELYLAWRKTGRWPKIASRWTGGSWDKPKQNARSVLRISRYLYEDSSWEIELDNNGRIAGYGARYDMGPYEGKMRYLEAREFNRALQKIGELPPNQPVFIVQDILVVSGRVGGRWITRVYSRRNLPRQVARLTQWLDKQLLNR